MADGSTPWTARTCVRCCSPRVALSNPTRGALVAGRRSHLLPNSALNHTPRESCLCIRLRVGEGTLAGVRRVRRVQAGRGTKLRASAKTEEATCAAML